jgi:hypothetical protein
LCLVIQECTMYLMVSDIMEEVAKKCSHKCCSALRSSRSITMCLQGIEAPRPTISSECLSSTNSIREPLYRTSPSMPPPLTPVQTSSNITLPPSSLGSRNSPMLHAPTTTSQACEQTPPTSSTIKISPQLPIISSMAWQAPLLGKSSPDSLLAG